MEARVNAMRLYKRDADHVPLNASRRAPVRDVYRRLTQSRVAHDCEIFSVPDHAMKESR